MRSLVRLLHDFGLGDASSFYWYAQIVWNKQLILAFEYSTFCNSEFLIENIKNSHNFAAKKYNATKFWFERGVMEI